MRRRFLLVPVLFLTLLGAGCPLGTETEGDEASADALVGIWRVTVPQEYESTLELFANGTFEVIDAEFGSQTCSTESGVWGAEGGVISATVTLINGQAVSESEEVPYELSGNTLTLNYVGDEPEVLVRADAMPTCADYGWPSFVSSAVIDGVPFEANSNPPVVVLQDAIDAGFLSISGWHDPAGPDMGCPSGCGVLELEIFNELATPLTTGTYTVDGFNPQGGLFARGTVRVDYPVQDLSFVTDDGDGVAQPWVGSVTLTTVTPLLIEGVFEFTAYNGRSGTPPPLPSVSVTNGFFRLSFE